MESIKVETEVFEGPLELLIYLIKRREVSIYDIPIGEITEEFLNYISTMQELNIPLASEFIYMAAILTKIKSEYLIPKEEEEDPRKPLVRLIEKYLHSKKAVKLLEELEDEASKIFSRDTSDLIFQFQDKVKIANTKDDLKSAYENLLFEKAEKPVKIGIRISPQNFKVSDKIEELRRFFSKNYIASFSKFIEKSSCKLEVITYFLAVLELVKLGELATFTDGKELFLTKVFPLSGEKKRVVVSTGVSF